MAAGRVLVAVVLCLCVAAVVGFEKEVKPNNYPNFEFHESPVENTAEVKPHNYGNEFVESTPGHVVEIEHQEYKPNNYPDFKFTEEENTPAVYEPQVHGDVNGHNQFAKGQYNSFDVSDRFPAARFNNHETFTAQDDVVYDAHQESFSQTGEPEYRGSDASNRYPSSYDLINARESENKVAGYEAFASNEVRFTNVHNVNHAPVQRSGSSRFYTPASDPDFAFRFAKPETTTTFGDNEFKVDNNADEKVYSQFNFDNSDATNDPTATYGSTSPVLAASNVKKQGSPVAVAGHGCANM